MPESREKSRASQDVLPRLWSSRFRAWGAGIAYHAYHSVYSRNGGNGKEHGNCCSQGCRVWELGTSEMGLCEVPKARKTHPRILYYVNHALEIPGI